MTDFPMAPELELSEWIGNSPPTSLESLRGRVVLIEVFQMLCPGCVSKALPQAVRAHALFPRSELVVLGLHSVFEHHEAQGSRAALEAFAHEYRIPFPIAMDAPGVTGPTPKTMERYQMRGTPTQLLIDRNGRLRKQSFGVDDEMRLGAEIASLLNDTGDMPEPVQSAKSGCTPEGCSLPE